MRVVTIKGLLFNFISKIVMVCYLCFYISSMYLPKTRTKTSIRYAKENDKEKRERRKERERKIEGKI